MAQNLTCGIVQKTGGNIMHDLKDRLKEPSSWGGFGLIATGVASILSHDYATGAAQIITGLLAVLRPEAMSGAK